MDEFKKLINELRFAADYGCDYTLLLEAAEKMEKLIDLLEENDDVQNIWHNWEMPEE